MMHKALPILLLSLCACGARDEAAMDVPADAPAVESTAPAQPSGEVPGPISSRGQAVPSGGGGGGQGSGLAFDVPQGWSSEPPSSSMRIAQATIPGSAGPGALTVFFFGPGGGGGVEDNIQRWIGQVETSEEPKQGTFETGNGYRVTWVEVAGTLQPSMMGTGPTEPQPNSRLLGAVVEGSGGPWFFKATGPDATLASQREAFLGMVRSVRPES